jgi:hypothetical protein
MKQTKLEIALGQKTKNWLEIEKLVSKSQNLNKIFLRSKSPKLREMIVKYGNIDFFNPLILKETMKPKYKEALQSLLKKQNYYCYGKNKLAFTVLINSHKLDLSPNRYLEFINNDERVYISKENMNKVKEYLLKTTYLIDMTNIDLIFDELSKKDILNLSIPFSNLKDKIKDKITFSDYLEIRPDKITNEILSYYGKDVILPELLKFEGELKISMVKMYSDKKEQGCSIVEIPFEKFDITREEMLILSKKMSIGNLYKFFNFEITDDILIDFVNGCNENINTLITMIEKIVLDGNVNKLNRYVKNSIKNKFDKFNFGRDICLSLYKKHIIGFKQIKPYLTEDEIQNILDQKKNTLVYLLKKLSSEKTNNDNNHDLCYGWHTHGSTSKTYFKIQKRDLIYKLIREYNFDSKMVLQLFLDNDIISNSHYGFDFILSMLLR